MIVVEEPGNKKSNVLFMLNNKVGMKWMIMKKFFPFYF